MKVEGVWISAGLCVDKRSILKRRKRVVIEVERGGVAKDTILYLCSAGGGWRGESTFGEW